jgi:hypothetical protein
MSYSIGEPVSTKNPLPVEPINSLGVKDNTGAYINPDSYAQNLTYNADGTIATVHFTDGANTWI